LNPEEAILFITPFLLFLIGNSTLYSKESSKVSNLIQFGPEGSFITSNFINIYAGRVGWVKALRSHQRIA
jgi:hypothetical protein